MTFTERDSLLISHGPRRKKSNLFEILRKNWVTVISCLCIASGLLVFLFVTPRKTPNDFLNDLEQEGIFLEAENEGNAENTTPESQNRRASTVRTSLGRIRGVNLVSRGGRDYYGFYNVPYAQPPLGSLRFMPPVPVKPWNGTRDGTIKGDMCTQKSRYNPNVAVEGSEDCLHVNIFTPQLPRFFRRPKFPVIVYFFGGGFMHGTANDFNCDYFMDEDVVMVIVESRVGALGYLNTGDLSATGNQGLKDQVEALRWVQNNIEDFGGDSKHVVAFGTSSGAICAHGHLLSPMSKGLMSGIMSFSGTFFTPNQFDTNPKETAIAFANAMNCSVENSEEMMSCLRNISPEKIALGQPNFTPSLETLPSDGNLTNVFFPETPFNIIKNQKSNNVPWIVGLNSAEAILQSYSLLLNDSLTSLLNNNWNQFATTLLSLNNFDEIYLPQVITSIRDFYFGNEVNLSKDNETRFNLTNLLSDRFYNHPTRFAGLNHAKLNSTYWYYLTKEANVSFADPVTQYFDPPYGVSHADEVQYFFSRPRYPYIPLDSEDADFSIMLVKLWVSFAKTGTPLNPDNNGTVWEKIDANSTGHVFFNLDDVPKLIEPFRDRMNFWDLFPEEMLYKN